MFGSSRTTSNSTSWLIHKSASLLRRRHADQQRAPGVTRRRGDRGVTSDYIYTNIRPSGGIMTQLRSKIVSRQSLNTRGAPHRAHRHVISTTNGSLTQKHIFGDAFRAMMAPFTSDQGYDFVNRLLSTASMRATSVRDLSESEPTTRAPDRVSQKNRTPSLPHGNSARAIRAAIPRSMPRCSSTAGDGTRARGESKKEPGSARRSVSQSSGRAVRRTARQTVPHGPIALPHTGCLPI